MKSIIIIFLSLFLIGATNHTTTAQSKKTDQFKVQVDGLGCPYCAFGLEKKFKELKGIKNMKIDIETGMLTFNYPATKSLNIEDVQQQVDKAGYTPVSVSIERANGKKEQSEIVVVEKEKAMETASFYVGGNCGMCKNRIETAAKGTKGVSKATWDSETEKLTIEFDSSKTSQAEIEKNIAFAGHDTASAKTSDKTYDNLHGCCKYERK